MNPLLMIAGGVLVSTAVTLALIVRSLLHNDRRREVDVEWLNGFSLSRYRVMERLLSRSDYDFLKSQRGYSTAIGRRLRRERCKVFRRYLSCLKRDFGRLEAAILLCAATANKDRPDFAKAILGRRLIFTCAVYRAEWCLLLFRFGLGSASVSELVGSLSGLRLELGQIVLAHEAAAA